MLRTTLLFVFALVYPFQASAEEIKVLSSNGLRAVLQEVIPQFERATGHHVSIAFSVAAELKKRIDAGEPFDLAILTPPLADDLLARGTAASGSRAALARAGMSLAIRRGASKPDLSTVDALKATLSAAPSIAFAREGAGGVFFTALMQQLGLADQLASKLKPVTTGDDVRQAVARGEAALGVMPLSEVLLQPGVEVGGVFPAAVQDYAVMVGVASARTTKRTAADAFLRFLMTPEVTPVIISKGMERVPAAGR